MRTPRAILLLSALLLVAAELVSLSSLVRGIGQGQLDRTSAALDKATALMPRIADWARTRTALPNEVLKVEWVEPFEFLIIEDVRTLQDDPASARRLEAGELVPDFRGLDRTLSVRGLLKTDHGPLLFRLVQPPKAVSSFEIDRTLVGQHALILLAALVGFALAALARNRDASEAAPALRAYEEAMVRLRTREDERLAAFDREKVALTSILRDKEAMARAGELTAGIVHEVRNSIGAIAMHAKLAEKTGDERLRSAAVAIGAEARSLQSVMTRFLDFIRTERMNYETFDLAAMIARVALKESDHCPSSMDVRGTRVLVEGDENLLERAIENVVRNACQAAGSAGSVTITFGVDATDAFVIVEDTGPGIADVTKALRPFESERPGGLGLGLPLVLKILSLHNGTFHLSSRTDRQGTQAICRWRKSDVAATSGNRA